MSTKIDGFEVLEELRLEKDTTQNGTFSGRHPTVIFRAGRGLMTVLGAKEFAQTLRPLLRASRSCEGQIESEYTVSDMFLSIGSELNF